MWFLLFSFLSLSLFPKGSFSLYFKDDAQNTHYLPSLKNKTLLVKNLSLFSSILFIQKDLKNIFVPKLPNSIYGYPSILRRYPNLKDMSKKYTSLINKNTFPSSFLAFSSLDDSSLDLPNSTFFIDLYEKESILIAKLLSNIFYKRDKADMLANLRNGVLFEVKKTFNNIYVNDRIRILYMRKYDKNGIYTFDPSNKKHIYLMKLFKNLSINYYFNPSNHSEKTISFDGISRFNPSIILTDPSIKPSSVYKSKILKKLNFFSLKAIQLKSVYSIPTLFHSWDTPGIEDTLFFIWLSLASYPKIFDPKFSCKLINKILDYMYDFNLTSKEISSLFVHKICE